MNTRIDKWLWCVRFYKTRSIATDACKSGLVKLRGENSKPAKELKVGDKLTIRRGVVTITIEVKDFPKSRVSAPLVSNYVIDHTPVEEYDKPRMLRDGAFITRDAGTGRPTKKDRRDIAQFGFIDWEDEEDIQA